MDMRLSGSKAVVTSSGAPVGLEVCKRLVAEGAEVTLVGASDDLRDFAGANGLTFVRADPAATDVATSLSAIVAATDVLVHDVYRIDRKPFARVTAEDWATCFATDVVSSAVLAQAFLPSMIERKGGRIVFVTSATAMLHEADLMPSSVAKSAQVALCRQLAATTGGTGVTVNCVLAGAVRNRTVLGEVASIAVTAHLDPQFAEGKFLAQRVPSALLDRLIKPEEVASLIAYVASPLAAATNGAILRADGGAAPLPF